MKVARDLAGIILIGDAVVGALILARHTHLYELGPRWWQGAMRTFARQPTLTRVLAAGELAAGLWIALKAESGARSAGPLGSTRR